MKSQLSRIDLIQEYELAPDWVFFSQETLAAIRDCSLATLERDRWAGAGVPFVKMGRLVRYRKSEIRAWLAQHQSVSSTTKDPVKKKGGVNDASIF
jgi:hypothetical protein